MLSRYDCDPLRWQEERALRQQLRGRFHDVCEAVAELRKKTIPASSSVENLNNEPTKNYYPGTEEAHTNPTRQRGECLRALAGASGSYVQGCETFLPG